MKLFFQYIKWRIENSEFLKKVKCLFGRHEHTLGTLKTRTYKGPDETNILYCKNCKKIKEFMFPLALKDSFIQMATGKDISKFLENILKTKADMNAIFDLRAVSEHMKSHYNKEILKN